MKIQKYEIWMREQIIALFKLEYGSDADNFDIYFNQFYEHAFQDKTGVRIVALEGDQVIGFQSFFNWPLCVRGQIVRSYQSGNSLVHPDFRGKGLFSKMLMYVHSEEAQIPCDLLIGFPVTMSFGAFIKNKWLNPFDLQWYVRPLRPIRAVLTQPDKKMHQQWSARQETNLMNSGDTVQVEQSKAYDLYRFAHQNGNYWRFEYEDNRGKILFELKSHLRKKILKELIIGRIIRTDKHPDLLEAALHTMIKKINDTASFSFLSIAINPLSNTLLQAIEGQGFKKIDKKIHFVTTGEVASRETDWSSWELYRGDIDTW